MISSFDRRHATLWQRLTGASLALLLLFLPTVIHAHPHGWIDMSMRLVFDDKGRLAALHQSWRMDPFYSLVILEELGQLESGDSLEAGLDQLGNDIRDNLSPHDYFTELRLGDDRLRLGQVSEYTVLERGGRVEFIFRLPLAEPVTLAGETLRYQVFDPSYYLEVVHEAGDDVPLKEALVVSGRDGCQTRIVPADPDPERVLAAAQLDVDEQGESGLGRYFAETGEVTCD